MKHLRTVTNSEENRLVGNHLFNDNYSMIVYFNDPENPGVPIVTKFVKEGKVSVHYSDRNSEQIYYADINMEITQILQEIAALSGMEIYIQYGYLEQRVSSLYTPLTGTTIGNSPEYNPQYDVYANYSVA